MADTEVYELGDKPQLGVVPKKMHAFLVRQDRFILVSANSNQEFNSIIKKYSNILR